MLLRSPPLPSVRAKELENRASALSKRHASKNVTAAGRRMQMMKRVNKKIMTKQRQIQNNQMNRWLLILNPIEIMYAMPLRSNNTMM